jgi:hypothetical protein
LIARRSLLVGLGASLFAAPAIVRASSLMPVRSFERLGWTVEMFPGWDRPNIMVVPQSMWIDLMNEAVLDVERVTGFPSELFTGSPGELFRLRIIPDERA